MGVTNLNILINLYKNKQDIIPKNMYAAIVDSNNMLFAYIQSAVKNLKSDFDIVKQTEYIISTVYSRVIEELDKFVKRYDIQEVWFVFDPRHKMNYNIDINLFDLIDFEYFKNKYKEDKFTVLLKDNEHNKRIQNITKREKQFEDPKEKEYYGFQNVSLARKLIKMIQKCLVNTSRFTNGCDWLDEEHDYLSNKYPMKEKYKMYVVQGEHTEADLVIKHLIEVLNILHRDNNFLIISRDTDYKILFSDHPNVWCTELNCRFSDVINPFITWQNFFAPLSDIKKKELSPSEIYDMTIRLSALIGNDYTRSQQSIINIKRYKNMNLPILKLFNNNIDAPINKRTTLGKLLSNYNYGISLDENIKIFNKDLYNVYIESVVIYKNWIMFNSDYAINTKHLNFDENLKIIYNKILKPEFDKSMTTKTEDEFVKAFYNVNTEYDDYLDAIEEDTKQSDSDGNKYYLDYIEDDDEQPQEENIEYKDYLDAIEEA